MSYNNQEYSDDLYALLYELGVYAQPDGRVAVADRLPRRHVENQYIVSFDSFAECLSYLESSLEEELMNFNSIWDSLEEDMDNLDLTSPNTSTSIQDLLVLSFIKSLESLAGEYKDLSDIAEKLSCLRDNIYYIDNPTRERLGYYSTLLRSMNAEILGENIRILALRHIKDNNQESGLINMLKYAYYSPWGMEEGVGPRGRNNPMTPFGGYDYWYDRVMDGTDIHDYSGGHATEKFLGRDGYNKFKKHPELLRKTRVRKRSKPLRYLSREKRRKLRKNKKRRGKTVNMVGRIVDELARDPTWYTWWDERKNPYTWENRDEESGYPTWSRYR